MLHRSPLLWRSFGLAGLLTRKLRWFLPSSLVKKSYSSNLSIITCSDILSAVKMRNLLPSYSHISLILPSSMWKNMQLRRGFGCPFELQATRSSTIVWKNLHAHVCVHRGKSRFPKHFSHLGSGNGQITADCSLQCSKNASFSINLPPWTHTRTPVFLIIVCTS